MMDNGENFFRINGNLQKAFIWNILFQVWWIPKSDGEFILILFVFSKQDFKFLFTGVGTLNSHLNHNAVVNHDHWYIQLLEEDEGLLAWKD